MATRLRLGSDRPAPLLPAFPAYSGAGTDSPPARVARCRRRADVQCSAVRWPWGCSRRRWRCGRGNLRARRDPAQGDSALRAAGNWAASWPKSTPSPWRTSPSRRGRRGMPFQAETPSPVSAGHDQLDELGDRPDFHFLHQPGPAVFDGSHAQVELRGDFLVEFSIQDQVQHDAFAGCQLGD